MPSMAVGQFNAASGTQTITVGFQPVAIIVTMNGQTANGSSPNFAPIWNVGYSAGVSNSGCMCFSAATGSQTQATERTRMALKLISAVNSSGTVVGECDVTAITSTGFSINWSTSPSAAYLINYTVIGGPNVSAKVVKWDVPTSTSGNPPFRTSVTGAGFEPRGAFHLTSAGLSTSLPSTVSSTGWGGSISTNAWDTFGASISNWSRVLGSGTTSSGFWVGDVAVTAVNRYGIGGAIVAGAGLYQDLVNSSIPHLATWDSDGFTYAAYNPLSAFPVVSLLLGGSGITLQRATESTGTANGSTVATTTNMTTSGAIVLPTHAGVSANNFAQGIGMAIPGGAQIMQCAFLSVDGSINPQIKRASAISYNTISYANHMGGSDGSITNATETARLTSTTSTSATFTFDTGAAGKFGQETFTSVLIGGAPTTEISPTAPTITHPAAGDTINTAQTVDIAWTGGNVGQDIDAREVRVSRRLGGTTEYYDSFAGTWSTTEKWHGGIEVNLANSGYAESTLVVNAMMVKGNGASGNYAYAVAFRDTAGTVAVSSEVSVTHSAFAGGKDIVRVSDSYINPVSNTGNPAIVGLFTAPRTSTWTCSNGVIWILAAPENYSTVGGQTPTTYYSTDGGVNWNTGSTAPFFMLGPRVDSNDVVHLGSGNSYMRGTPNAGRTSYTWTSASVTIPPQTPPGAAGASTPTLNAPNGSIITSDGSGGVIVHCAGYLLRVTTGVAARLYWCRFPVDSAGTAGAMTVTEIMVESGTAGTAFPVAAEARVGADGMTPISGLPHLCFAGTVSAGADATTNQLWLTHITATSQTTWAAPSTPVRAGDGVNNHYVDVGAYSTYDYVNNKFVFFVRYLNNNAGNRYNAVVSVAPGASTAPFDTSLAQTTVLWTYDTPSGARALVDSGGAIYVPTYDIVSPVNNLSAAQDYVRGPLVRKWDGSSFSTHVQLDSRAGGGYPFNTTLRFASNGALIATYVNTGLFRSYVGFASYLASVLRTHQMMM